MTRPLLPFAVASGGPVILLLMAGFLGGIWILLAIAWLSIAAFALDELMQRETPVAEDDQTLRQADQLSVALGVAHFVLLIVGISAIAGMTGLGFWSRLGAFLAFGLFFGQVSNSNAHELIHRSRRGLFHLGMWIYISLLFGHHTSAHRLVHHRFVATDEDPNTAQKSESFYEFAPRAWLGSFVAGYEMEKALEPQSGKRRINPYVIYIGGAAGFAIAVLAIFGVAGLFAYLALAGYAQTQLLLSDYVQHYGLRRSTLSGGRYEAIRPAHSWNSPHWFSSALMLNAPRHSDHHAHPARPFPALTLPAEAEAPMLPMSLPAMAAIALVPQLFRRVIHPRLAEWDAARRRKPAVAEAG